MELKHGRWIAAGLVGSVLLLPVACSDKHVNAPGSGATGVTSGDTATTAGDVEADPVRDVWVTAVKYRDEALKAIAPEAQVDAAAYCGDAASVFSDPATHIDESAVSKDWTYGPAGTGLAFKDVQFWNSQQDELAALYQECMASADPNAFLASQDYSDTFDHYATVTDRITGVLGLAASFPEVTG